jgi:hypothetical protein
VSWLVWRQHRWDAASTFAVVGLFGGAMLALTLASANLVAEMARVCSNSSPHCGELQLEYATGVGAHQAAIYAAISALPLLLGIFVGGPLIAREFEHGTHLLVWTQGITRRRWFGTKVALVTAGVMVAAALLGTAFQVRITQQEPIFGAWSYFDARPPVFIAYTLFAVALGMAAGAVIQRTLPAMAATVGGFVAARVAIEQLARPNYQPTLIWDVGNELFPANSSFWFIGLQTHIDLNGRPISDSRWGDTLNQCAAVIRGDTYGSSLHNCLLDHGVRVVQHYQPGSRLWLFQSIEAAIFVALAAALLVVAYKMVMRKN